MLSKKFLFMALLFSKVFELRVYAAGKFEDKPD
jgi:hypothetical protein